MNVCTDSARFAREWLVAPSGWTTGRSRHLPDGIHALVRRLVPAGPLATACSHLPRPWQYALLVEHARRSQFDILVGALREGMALPDGVVCLAGSGEGFHGQRERAWAAMAGNLHLSVFLSPGRHLNEIGTGLTILPAVSLVQALDTIPGITRRAGIRWVSDIVIGGSKIAGHLVHTQSSNGRVTGVVIGMGLNVETVPPVAPTVFVPSVTALRQCVPDSRMCTRADVLGRVLRSLGANYEKLLAGRTRELLEVYRERSVVLGQPVDVYADRDGGTSRHAAGGIVAAIGDRLELVLAGRSRPVLDGRLVMHAESFSP